MSAASVVAYAIPGTVALWALSEVVLAVARRGAARGDRADRGSMRLVFLACGLGCWAAFVAASYRVAPIRWPAGPRLGIAAASFAAGLVLRWVSILTLGRLFTTRVTVQDGHELVRRGPYRWLRHPSYTGMVLILVGIGLALGDAIALALAVGVPLAALLYRIRVEERVLANAFGEAWERHRAATWRLVPWVW